MAGFNNIGPGRFLRIVHQAYEFALDNGAQKETIFYHIHNPGIFSTFNFLSDMPDARLMMMVRDPVKSLESWVREAARDNEYATLSLFIISMLFSIDRVAFRRQESIGVRLEDLKSRPKETMRALCKWIGIEETPSLYEMTAQGKKWWGDPTSPDYDQKKEMSPFDDACFKRPTGYVFSERDCFLLETLFHPFSVRFGYQEDDPDRFKGNLKEARTMLEDLFDFEQNIIENTNGKPDEFRQSGDHLLLRATLTDRLDVLEEFGTYPHMLKPLVLDESA